MPDEKTLENFLIEALDNSEIEYNVIVSDNGGKKRFYLISKDVDSKTKKQRIVGFEVKGNKVKQII